MVAASFTEILEKDQLEKLIPFLQALGDKKRDLLPELKKLYKIYSAFIQERRSDGGVTMIQKAKGSQSLILSMTAFVCGDEKTFSSMYGANTLTKETMDTILPWYCPSWFSSFMNKFATADYIPFSYDWYMELVEHGYIQPSDEIIAKLLPASIFERGEKWNHIFAPQNLYKRKITLERHIWLIFQHETNIHSSDRYLKFVDGSKEGRWLNTFKTITNERRISRERVLSEALLATSKNFNQALSGWFADLFVFLEPSTDELLNCKRELLNSLTSNSTKQVNTALKYIKSLIISGQFDESDILEYLNITINSNTKSIVISTLVCLEQLVKDKKNSPEIICGVAVNALIHNDDTIQTRVAKLVQKYSDPSSEPIVQGITEFEDGLFLNSKSILIDFLNTQKNETTASKLIEETSLLVKDEPEEIVKLPVIKTFEDLLFLASQAFDNNESYHFDQLPASLLLLQEEIRSADINKFAPALQRALKLVHNDFRNGIGFLDHLLATFFADYITLLVITRPDESVELQKVYTSFDKTPESWKLWKGVLKQWKVHNKSKIYEPQKEILLSALYYLQNGLEVPLLSAPDYFPCWLSATSLIDRLKVYQTKGVEPSLIDFQIATSRFYSSSRDGELALAAQGLKGEYKEVVEFLGGKDLEFSSAFNLKSVWLAASVKKSILHGTEIWRDLSSLPCEYLTGDFTWSASAKKRYLQSWDMKQHKYADTNEVVIDRELRISFPQNKKEPSGVKPLLTSLINKSDVPSVYEYLKISSDWISTEPFDIKRLIFLLPENPSPILAQIIHKCLVYSKCWEEVQKRMVTKALEALLELPSHAAPMLHLYIAACLLNSDKTIAVYAAEIWIKGVANESIKSEEIGSFIGMLERYEYSPLKRLTDLALNNMFKISPRHNKALETLISACIKNLGDNPINNTKKLLEVYLEVLMLNKVTLQDQKVIEKLRLWRENGALKKIVDNIPGM